MTDASPATADAAAPARAGLGAHGRDWLAFAAVVAAFCALPVLGSGFSIYLGCIVIYFAIAALGLQIMVGFAGQLSLGHAAFIGIGAYGTVLAEQRLGLSFVPASLIGTLAASLAGLLMAQMIRLSGIYFKIATFGFGIIIHQMMTNWVWLTGGTAGLKGIRPIEIAGHTFSSRLDLYLLELGALVVVYALLLRLTHGRIGRAFRALGQNEAAARSIGIPTTAYRMVAITLGCAVAGFAGTFMPHVMRFVSPETFNWHESLVLLIMITVGGLASLPGAIIGAAVMIVLPEYMRDLAEYKMLAYGLLLIACLTVMPRGVAGVLDAMWRRSLGRSL